MEQGRLLEVVDLRVSFRTRAGEVQAVRGASWHLRERETVALVGESGCGKTAGIQAIMGLHAKKSGCSRAGKALYGGKNLLSCTDSEMRAIQGAEMSIIFQDPFTYLNPTMSVGRQIAEAYSRHRKASKREAMEKTLEILRTISFPSPEQGLRRYPHQLSGGMRQRVMIAMALVCSPKILFADEPTTALDVTIQAQIIELMKGLKEKAAMSIVLVTHDLGVVANMADRVYVMYAGKIVEHGDARSIFRNPRHPYTEGLLGSVPRADSGIWEKGAGVGYGSGTGTGAGAGVASAESAESAGGVAGWLRSIPGAPPDLLAPPKGCAFAARCPHAMNICYRREPGNTPFGANGRYAACWLRAREQARGGGGAREREAGAGIAAPGKEGDGETPGKGDGHAC
ncbi:MAG: ABC transporter ATP-binding protein [Clostridiales bacterium]|jgi:ABC-type dipeptide/oligopeptide/nickel transport system ATPase component|nr:ABC transporter ATP-binding protein [Clostridiales bacterium]